MQKVAKLNYKIALMQFCISQREIANTLGYTEQYLSIIVDSEGNAEKFSLVQCIVLKQFIP